MRCLDEPGAWERYGYPRQLETVVVFGMPFGIPRESMKSAVASPMTPAKSAS